MVALFGKALLDRLDELTDRLVEAILAEDPSYSGPESTPRAQVRQSCRDNLHRVLQVLTGDTDRTADPFDAPRATGRDRAQQGMPLESVLHAYRVGFRVIWEGLVAQARETGDGVEPLVDAATEVWELVDVFSSAVADSYRETEAELARRGDRRREALVDALLDGRGTERTIASAAAAALDLPEHGRYAVAVVADVEAHRAAGEALRARGLRTAWRARSDREIALVALGTAESAAVVAALDGVGGLRAGVSPPVDGLAEVDVAHRLAETALRALPPQTKGISELDDRLPAALVVTAPDLAMRLLSRALGGVLALDPDERRVLLQTLREWLDTGGSAGQTAVRLYCHRNTVLNRLRRVEALTDRSVERVDHLVEWSLALLALDVLPPGANGPAA
jgi:DNA-binding CsgD family transcriptional regulator